MCSLPVCPPSPAHAEAVTLALASAAELEPLRLALYDLTPREREVARLLIRGECNDEIASYDPTADAPAHGFGPP